MISFIHASLFCNVSENSEFIVTFDTCVEYTLNINLSHPFLSPPSLQMATFFFPNSLPPIVMYRYAFLFEF